jgi:hypothetical protein
MTDGILELVVPLKQRPNQPRYLDGTLRITGGVRSTARNNGVPRGIKRPKVSAEMGDRINHVYPPKVIESQSIFAHSTNLHKHPLFSALRPFCLLSISNMAAKSAPPSIKFTKLFINGMHMRVDRCTGPLTGLYNYCAHAGEFVDSVSKKT